jgi:hypothetical protein
MVLFTGSCYLVFLSWNGLIDSAIATDFEKEINMIYVALDAWMPESRAHICHCFDLSLVHNGPTKQLSNHHCHLLR